MNALLNASSAILIVLLTAANILGLANYALNGDTLSHSYPEFSVWHQVALVGLELLTLVSLLVLWHGRIAGLMGFISAYVLMAAINLSFGSARSHVLMLPLGASLGVAAYVLRRRALARSTP